MFAVLIAISFIGTGPAEGSSLNSIENASSNSGALSTIASNAYANPQSFHSKGKSEKKRRKRFSSRSILEALQGSYRKLGEFSADFSQTYVDKLRGRGEPETGMLWVKKDGRVRWSYQTPIRKDFVYDGNKAYFYEPANAQVTVFEKFQDSQLSVAMRFLWGQGDIENLFKISSCDSTCDEFGEKGDLKMKLHPNEPMATLKWVVLVVDSQTKRPKLSVIFDNLGNRTEYGFSSFQKRSDISAKKFAFKIPHGVSVLRSSLAAGPQ